MAKAPDDEDDIREQLVEVIVADGLILDGVVITPGHRSRIHGEVEPPVPVVWIHGWSRSFLAPTPLRVGRALARRGHTFVGANTRGAGYGMPLRTADGWVSQLGGGIWELFSESPLDVAAWVTFGAELGSESGSVFLLGHSLGGLKVLHYLAGQADTRVGGLCLASPPVRPHQFEPEMVRRAEQMVAEGRGTQMLLWEAGQPVFSAQTFLDRARVDLDLFGLNHDRTDTPAIGRLRCPVLALYGEAEPGASVALERIRQGAAAAARVEAHLVVGADHAYTNREEAVASLLSDWIASLA
jgi:pimeloyl-ACP methyl ester carboxylesterase